MKVTRVIKSGLPGSRKLEQQYGDNLICVRYRFDEENQQILKTVELIVETTPWDANTTRIPVNKLVHIRIAPQEKSLRIKVKQAGGKWNPQLQLWRLKYQKVLDLGLIDRMIARK